MSEMSTAESNILHGKASNKFPLTLPSFTSRIIAQSDSLTKYEASTQHRINASAANASCHTTGKDASSVVDSNNNCRQPRSLEESADDHGARRQLLDKKKSSAKKKKKKKPHTRSGKELSCEDPAVASLTCQASPLENDDREDTTKSGDQISITGSEIDSSLSPKSSCSDVPLSTESEQPEPTECSNQQQSKEDGYDAQQSLLIKVTSYDEVPSYEQHLQNDCSQVQHSETSHIHSMAETAGSEAITSDRGSSVPKGLLPSDTIPTVAGLEKSRKDLQRQMALLHRLTPVLKEQMEKSLNSIAVTFQEIHDRLNNRKTELVSELNRVISQASTILSEQKRKGEQLKYDIQQLVQPTDSEIAQLKSDIKQYVSKRKVYEDMSERHRFISDWTNVLEEINKFGEIVPLEAADYQFPVILIPSGSDLTQSPTSPLQSNGLETPSAAITLTTTTDDNIEIQSLSLGIQAWPLGDGQSPSEILVDNGENMRQDVVDLRPTENQVPSSTGGVTVQMEQDHRQRNSNDEVLIDSAVVSEATAAKESRRMNSWGEDEVQSQSADNLNGTPSPNADHPFSNSDGASDAEINGLSSYKQRNLKDPNNNDVRLHMYCFKDKNSPKNLFNRFLPSNSTSTSQTKAIGRQIAYRNSGKQEPFEGQATQELHTWDPPLEQGSGNDHTRLKSRNTAQEKCHPQQMQGLHSSPGAKSDYHRPLSDSLLNKSKMLAKHIGSSLVKSLHVLDADQIKTTEDGTVLLSSTEPGENKEQKESGGNSNKKKKKKKKAKKSKDHLHMENTVHDDGSPASVSDYSKNGAVSIQRTEGIQQTNLNDHVTGQDQWNSAKANTEQLANKQSSSKKHKKSVVKKNYVDDKSLRCDNIVRKYDESPGVKSEIVFSAALDKPRDATRSPEACLQKQNCASKTGKTDDRNAENECKENVQKDPNVALKNAAEKCPKTYSRISNAADICKRENTAPNLNISLQKQDKSTLNHSGNSVRANRSRDERLHVQMKVNNRPTQNQNSCPVQREEAEREKHNLTLKGQQRSEMKGLRAESNGVLKPKNSALKVTDSFQKSKEAKQVRTTLRTEANQKA